MVYVDGVSRFVDCSDLPEDFHALQWKEDKGWVEFRDNYKAPEDITDITPYQKYIDQWVVNESINNISEEQ